MKINNAVRLLFLITVTMIMCLPSFGQQDHAYHINSKVDSFIINKMKSFQIPGASLAVLKRGQVIYAKGYGEANIELKVPANPETNYLIGSITKTFAATAAMILWEEGRFKLEDTIGKYLPGLPPHWKPVTIRQLLNHTSGIVTNLGKADAVCKFDFDCDNYTQQNLIQETACLPLRFTPGTKWQYSGRGYYVIGMLIEKLSGKTFGAFLEEKIFHPLGMSETGMIEYEKIIPNRAAGYIFENGLLKNSKPMNAVVELSDGGLISTVKDLAKWDASFYTEKILKSATINMMWSNARLNDGTIVPSYGIGFGLTPFEGHKRVGHAGGIPGFSSIFTRFTEHNLSVIILTNITNNSFNVGQFGNEIAKFYFNEVK